jgi:acyl-coenzyme A thioesterase 13
MVDLGGSLAVASKGLYATGVSTDLNGELCTQQVSHINYLGPMTDALSPVTYLSSGGKVGDTIKATALCEKSEPSHTPLYQSLLWY